MPVTAKLSRQFYDRMGDEIANELVDWLNAVDDSYRAELRQINEQNYARFDAKLEQRIGELKAEIAGLKADMDARFTVTRADLRAEMLAGFARTRSEIAAARADLIKWMFVFVATATLAILGLG